MPEKVSVAQAATALGISPVRVRQLIWDGRLPAERVGRAYLIAEESLAAVKKQPRRSGRPRLVVHRGSLVWDAAASSILALGQAEANRFLAALSGAELHRLGLKDTVRRYSLEERAGDGGCDLLIRVPGALKHRYIPGGTSVWQVKSGKRPPDAADEIDSPKHAFVREQLIKGASYVLACTQSFTPQTQERILAEFREHVHAINPASDVHLLVANDLAEWSINHPSIVRSLSPPLSVLFDWQQWDRAVRGDEALPFIADEQRQQFVTRIRNWVTDSSDIGPFLHIYGASGVGKTRLTLEAFDTTDLRDQVVYIDAPDRASTVLLDELIDSADDLGVLVVDNCDFDQVGRLHALAARASGKLRLITLGGLAGLNRSRPTSTYWRLYPLEKAPAADSLKRALGLDAEQALFVANLTEGYPLLAWLLGRRLRDGSINSVADFSTRSDHAAVLADLVSNEEDRRHLGVIALFTRLGTVGELRVELDAVCLAFELKAPEVLRTLNNHPDLVKPFGRFVQVTPGLVCAWLIAGLLHDFGSDTVMQWVSHLPADLQERFAAQIGVLGEDPLSGPLAATLLQSIDLREPRAKWSSSLRAAASLDHANTARWLATREQHDPASFREALGEMNSIRILEHLLWFEDSFAPALGMLFRLALKLSAEPSEPEAQAILGGVFLTHLGGTAVPYDRRVSALRKLVDTDGGDAARGVGIRALMAGLALFEGRTTPSMQGGTILPTEWRPQTQHEDHAIRMLVWEHLLELLDGLRDGTEREQFWLTLTENLGVVARILDPDVWLKELEQRQWPIQLRIKLRHALGLVAGLDGLPQPFHKRIDDLCTALGPSLEPIDLADFLLSGEPYHLARSYADEVGEVREACASLAAHMASDDAVFTHVLDAAAQAHVSTVGIIFEEFARLQNHGNELFEEILAHEPPVALALAGYLSGRERCDGGEWVTQQITRVPAAIPQVLLAVAATRERAQLALDSAKPQGIAEWVALARPLLLPGWRAVLSDEQFAQIVGQLLLATQGGYRGAALAGLDDWSQDHPGLSELLLDLTERALLATANDIDPMLSFHRGRLLQRVPITYETRLAVALTVANGRHREPSELAGLFRPLIAERGVQALEDVFAAINRERETESWSRLDHDIRGVCLLSLAAADLGADAVWQLIERGGLGATPVIDHVDMETEEPSDLVVTILEGAAPPVVDAARSAFIHSRRASYGSMVDVLVRSRDRALHWATASSSARVREWASEVAAAIDAGLPMYQQREAEFG